MDIAAIAARAPVIPVLTIERTADAVPLARALVKGGLPVLEVTLRTPVALDALRVMAAEVPDALLGAGTVLDAVQLDQARRAGAQFLVSPGCTRLWLRRPERRECPSCRGPDRFRAMALSQRGFRLMKFFPAGQAGGLGWLKAVAAPLAGLRFCPTGGIGPDTAPSYLALANVACVSGSWMAPSDAVAAGDWGKIERLAAAVAALKRPLAPV